MSRHHKPRAFWRLARIWFRHARMTVWLSILLVLLTLIYLQYVGLPGFVEKAIARAFAANGIRLEFSRIHVAWFKSIQADDVRVQPSASGWVPRIECRKLDLHFDPTALLRLRIVPEELTVEDGRLILPYPETNGVSRQLTATNLQSVLRFTPGGQWSLESLTGVMEGCRVSAAGTITHGALIQDWRILGKRAAETKGPAYKMWQAASRIRDEFKFLSPPELRVRFDVDGAVPERLSFWMLLKVNAASCPWGLLENPEIALAIEPTEDRVCSEASLTVQADRVFSGSFRGEHLTFSSAISCLPESGSLLAGRATLSAQRLDTRWAGASDLELSLGWSGDGTNLVPAQAELHAQAATLSTEQGLAEGFRMRAQVAPFQGDHRQVLSLPRFLVADLEPMTLVGSAEIDQLETFHFVATNLAVAVDWSCPKLRVSKLRVDWAGGHLDGQATLDAISGRLTAQLASDFDPQQFRAILPRKAATWLSQFTWQEPPAVNGVLGVTLPAWDPTQLLWPGDLRPSLDLNGQFDIGPGTFNRIPVSGASSHFTYSNMCWHLPDLTVKRPDGLLRLEHGNNDRTGEFSWRVDGAVDPSPAMILVPQEAREAREVLGTLRFTDPPEVHLTLAGCWHDLEGAQAWGSVRATRFAFRGCAFDELDARVGLTNLTLTVGEPNVRAGKGTASATSLSFDFRRQFAYLTNGLSSMPPMTIATVIGPQIVEAIEAYQFLEPPDGRVQGVIPLKGVAGADMRFALKGGPFRWQDFNLQHVDALVLWRGQTVTLTNVQAEFYGGTASGEAFFEFAGRKDADFWFNIRVDEADIQPLVTDVFHSTNRLEGVLGGALSVTQGNTGDFGSWFGYGHARLEEGYIWSVPIFGVLSPVLDLFVPGLGSSRAKEAEGRFSITNSVIRTDDLVIHTSNMRLLYTGTVDFNGAVDAVAEAEILRDTVLVGGIVSVVLSPLSKAMIVEIRGTLAEPEARPLYLLPRVLLAPLNPVKTFKDLFAPPAPKYQELSPDPDEVAPQ